ncbi:MAG: MBOAT family O-acyltransferase [Marinosulfonomonas sp.]
MIFSTNVFVFVFLPTFIGLYHLTPWRFKSHFLLAASYAFYGWWRVEFLFLIFGMSAFSYYMAKLSVACNRAAWRKGAMLLGVGIDLACLGYFKYANFFLDNVNSLLVFTGNGGIDFEHVLLPIGISFHTFQSISYVIDVYRRDAPPAKRLVDFLAFGALFPQLIAGPVLRYKDIAAQFVSRDHSLKKFNIGCSRFFLGLAMKVLIADGIAPLADRMFALENPSFTESWLGAMAYTFQLYFDFAGYSSMAIGLGLMLGFRFIENFNAPYTSRSITEFWQRWHISLSTWLRDYLYIPLGGNRCGRRRTYINIMLTMILGGFWHGANWTFLVWGIWHGGIMAVERWMGAKQTVSVWPRAISMPLTFAMVMVGWVVFRSPNLGSAFAMYRGMLGLNDFAISPDVLWRIKTSEITVLLLVSAAVFFPSFSDWRMERLAPPIQSLLMTLIAILAISRMVGQGYSPFLYFQF